MRVLSLFSGGGLGDYGLTLAGMEIVGQVEIDEYCQKILKLRWPDVPKWRDIRDVKGSEVLEKCGRIDLVAGGFPCQPFSVAGRKKGKDDERNMWPEMYRIISEIKPPWVFAENVRGIVKPYLDTVLSDLEGLGYSCLSLLIPASAIGAPHRRERLWIIAYSEIIGTQGRIQQRGKTSFPGKDGENRGNNDVAHSNSSGLGKRWGAKPIQKKLNSSKRIGKDMADTFRGPLGTAQRPGTHRKSDAEQNNGNEIWDDSGNSGQALGRFWSVESGVGRVAHGVPNRVDRLKLLGNGQVVQVVEWIGKRIMEYDRQRNG